jgi:hypothetical protein
MSPLEVQIMLHYRCISEDFRDLDAPAIREAIDNFIDENMLTEGSQWPNCRYSITEKGRAYVEMVCALKVPVAIVEWRQP